MALERRPPVKDARALLAGFGVIEPKGMRKVEPIDEKHDGGRVVRKYGLESKVPGKTAEVVILQKAAYPEIIVLQNIKSGDIHVEGDIDTANVEVPYLQRVTVVSRVDRRDIKGHGRFLVVEPEELAGQETVVFLSGNRPLEMAGTIEDRNNLNELKAAGFIEEVKLPEPFYRRSNRSHLN